MEKNVAKICKKYSTSTELYKRINKIVKTYHRFCAGQK
jgi:hypothetical protein